MHQRLVLPFFVSELWLPADKAIHTRTFVIDAVCNTSRCRGTNLVFQQHFFANKLPMCFGATEPLVAISIFSALCVNLALRDDAPTFTKHAFHVFTAHVVTTTMRAKGLALVASSVVSMAKLSICTVLIFSTLYFLQKKTTHLKWESFFLLHQNLLRESFYEVIKVTSTLTVYVVVVFFTLLLEFLGNVGSTFQIQLQTTHWLASTNIRSSRANRKNLMVGKIAVNAVPASMIWSCKMKINSFMSWDEQQSDRFCQMAFSTCH